MRKSRFNFKLILTALIVMLSFSASSLLLSGNINSSNSEVAHVETRGAIINRSITVYAYCNSASTPSTYTNTADGGTVEIANGDAKASDSYEVTTDSFPSVEITAASEKNYTFDGWYTSNDFSTLYSNDTSCNIEELDGDFVMYYAKFSIKSGTITYNTNNGISIENSNYYSSLTEQSKTLETPTRAGYTFAGYTITTNSTPISSVNNLTLTIPANADGDITVQASWTANTYSITYKDQGAADFSGNNLSALPTTHTYGTETTLVSATKTGYSSGWFTTSDCSETNITSLNATAYTENIILYAKWTACVYDVTYDTDGGNTIEKANYTFSTSIQSKTLTAPTKAGYTFAGYTITTNSTPASSVNNLTLSIPANAVNAITITASWTANTYSITYKDQDTADFSGDNLSILPATFTYGTATTLVAATKTGYTFNGWFTTSDCSETNITSLNATSYTTDITLYAKWTANTYTITLNNQNATTAGTTTIYEIYNTGWYFDAEGTSAITSIICPEKTGYSFVGYFIGDSETKIIDKNGNIIVSNNYFVESKIIYANWVAKTYNINYETNGGTIISSQDVTYTFGQTTTLPTSVIKTGYTFIGWFANSGLTGSAVSNISATETEDKTFWAKWEISTYTITLNDQGGTTTIYEKYNTGWYSDAEATTEISSITAPTKDHYIFGGYFTLENGAGTQIIDNNGKILVGTDCFSANATIYAYWIPVTYSITLNSQEATTAGTTTIYEKYNTGWYSNVSATTEISSITIPQKGGYVFAGYYTGESGSGQQIISALGIITADKTYFTNNETPLYACWKEISSSTFSASATTSDGIIFKTIKNNTTTGEVTSSSISFAPNMYVILSSEQSVWIEFGYANITSTSMYVLWLSVDYSINGTPQAVTDVKINNVRNANYYQQRISGENPTLEYGLHKFVFTYRTKSGLTLSETKTVEYSFTLIKQSDYSESFGVSSFNSSYKTAKNGTYAKEATYSEDDQIDSQNYVYSPFISNALTNVVKADNIVSDEIKKYASFYNFSEGANNLPSISFDQSKYVVTISRSYYALTESISTFTNNSYVCGCKVEVDGNNVTVTFNDLGTYTISYAYKYGSVVLDSTNSLNTNIPTEILNIYGFQIYYAKDNTSEAEFKGTNSAYLVTNGTDYSLTTLPTVTTNQAPVWFKFLTTSNNVTSCKIYKNGETGASYVNGIKFTESGKYVVKVSYNFTNSNYGISQTGTNAITQWFAFEIKNTSPVLTLETTVGDTTTSIPSGSYTNKTVKFDVTTPGDFDSDVKLEIRKDGTLVNTLNGASEINGFTGYTDDGSYTLKLFYGATGKSYITSSFTIDTTPVAVKYGNTDFTKTYKTSNTQFNINWEETNASATYCFAPISYNSSLTGLFSGTEFMQNGYEIGAFGNAITYKSKTTLTAVGVYYFEVTDLAGNKTQKIVILDNTKPAYTQTPAKDATNVYNMYDSDVTLTFGNYKAIKMPTSNTSSAYTFFTGTANIPEIQSGYLTSAINSKIEKSYTNSTISSDWTAYTSTTLAKPTDSDVIYYNVSITDNTGNTTGNILFEINLDPCQGMILDKNKTYNNNETSVYARIYPNNASNLNTIVFQFKKGELEKEVVSLTYTYYPFAYDTASENYPFASTSAITNKNIMPTGTGTLTTDVINPNSDGNISSGYYTITRTLSNGDEKSYNFVIDRNNIKSSPTYSGESISYLYGSGINFSLGTTSQTTFSNFISNTTNTLDAPTSLLFTTNKLPAKLNLPENKYNESTATATKNIVKLNAIVEATFKVNNADKTVVLLEKTGTQNVYYVYNSDGTVAHKLKFDNKDGFVYSNDYINGYTASKLARCTSETAFNNALLSFVENFTYTVHLFDNTASLTTGTTESDTSGTIEIKYDEWKQTPNVLTFKFAIEHEAPRGYWNVDNVAKTEIDEITQSPTNSENVTFTFTLPDDNEVTMAKIDVNNIVVTKQLKGEVSATTLASTAYTLSSTDNVHYTITLNGTEECEYTITLCYEGTETDYVVGTKNFFKTTHRLIIDNTAPAYTLSRLEELDSYAGSGKLDDGTYAYAIDSDFAFINSSSESYNDSLTGTVSQTTENNFYKEMETSKIYYREYSKYETGEANLPSMLPSDPNYSDYSVQRDRLRFNANDISNFHSFTYGTTAFASLSEIKKNTYYEIIEIDGAGNYTSFTVYIPDNSFYLSINEKHDAENEDKSYTLSNTNTEKEINCTGVSVNSMQFLNSTNLVSDMWFTASLNVGGNTNKFYFTPSTDFTFTNTVFTPNTSSQNLTEINNLITNYLAQESVIISGGQIVITIIPRVGETLTYTINVAGTQKLELSYTDDNTLTGNFELVVPRTASTYINSIKVYPIENGKKGTEKTLSYNSDYENGYIISNTSFNKDTIFLVEYTDNFGRTNSLLVNYLITDVASADRLNFTETSLSVGGTPYTSGNVEFTFQSKLYTISVKKNGNEILNYSSVDNLTISGVKTITFKPADNFTTTDVYVVTLSYLGISDAESTLTYEFNITTVLPNVLLKDALGTTLFNANTSASNLITTKKVFLNWTVVENFAPAVSVTGTLDNGTIVSYTQSQLENGKSFFIEPGNYVVTISNTLGNVRNVEFSIIEDKNLYYWVIESATGNILTASDSTISYNGEEITLYNTNLAYGDYEIVPNQDKNITCALIETVGNIRYFEISGTTTHIFNKVIAVSTIEKTNNILSTFSVDSLNIVTSGSSTQATLTKYATSATLSWSSSFSTDSNKITAYVSYNNNEFVKVPSNTLTLSLAGNYRIKFNDDAGNSHTFAYETTQESSYYSFNLVNAVWIETKQESESSYSYAIENKVYNEAVSLILNGTSYLVSGSINITATKNGATYNFTRNDRVLTFTEQGYYVVTISGKLISDIVLDQTIQTIYCFTIVKGDEARLAYNLVTPSNQKINKIFKITDNEEIDITDEIKAYYSSNSLSNIFISPSSIGEGKYRFEMEFLSDNLVLENSTYSFDIWVNNETPSITSSRAFGTEGTSKVTLTINKALIYSQIGACKITITGQSDIEISEQDANSQELTTIQLSSIGTYFIRLETNSGQVVLSNKITIKEPLNSIAIFVIVLCVILAAVGLVIFLKLRTHMRVR